MGRRTIAARAAGFLICVVALATGTLFAQAGRRVAQGQLVFDPFPEARAAIAGIGGNDETALSSMLATIRDGTPVFYFRVSALASDQNAARSLVRTLGRYLPRVVASEPFGAAYTRLRDDAINAAAGSPPVDPSLSRLDRISTLRSDIEGYQGELRDSTLSRSDRNRIRDQLDEARDRLEDLEEQANDSRARERERRAFETAQAEYTQRRTAAAGELEARMPADVRVAVARRLNQFIGECGDVSFSARTTRNAAGVRVFASAEHEAKSKLWKMCFRAGRRTTDEARRLARSWLAELARAGIRP